MDITNQMRGRGCFEHLSVCDECRRYSIACLRRIKMSQLLVTLILNAQDRVSSDSSSSTYHTSSTVLVGDPVHDSMKGGLRRGIMRADNTARRYK